MARALTDIRSLARVHTKTAINVLAGIMNEPSAPPSARVTAAQTLLDRGWGRPEQHTSSDNTVRFVVALPEVARSTAEWLERYAPKRIADQTMTADVGDVEEASVVSVLDNETT